MFGPSCPASLPLNNQIGKHYEKKIVKKERKRREARKVEEVSTVFTSKNKCNNEISTSLKYAPHLGKNKCCGLNEAPIPRIPSQAVP